MDEKIEAFREALKDAATLVESIAPLCTSFEEMVGLFRSAAGDEQSAGNDATLRLLMLHLKGGKKR